MRVLHRFVAGSASAARRQVGAALGRDALLLSCRDVQEGIEIIAVPATVWGFGRGASGLMRNRAAGQSREYAQPETTERAFPGVHEVA